MNIIVVGYVEIVCGNKYYESAAKHPPLSIMQDYYFHALIPCCIIVRAAGAGDASWDSQAKLMVESL